VGPKIVAKGASRDFKLRDLRVIDEALTDVNQEVLAVNMSSHSEICSSNFELATVILSNGDI
jgi:hypothetical protein